MLFWLLLAGKLVTGEQIETMSVLSISDGVRFRMGKVDARRIVHPEMGAKLLTLNYAVSEPGHEFPQHVHEYSDDIFLVLKGQVDVRQGHSRRPLLQGKAAFVPQGQIHGTITTGNETAILISFQCPPDAALYTGERDSPSEGAPPPKGVVTPGAVRFLDFHGVDGSFLGPETGSPRVAISYWKLVDRKSYSARVQTGGELILFVWKGTVLVKNGSQSLTVKEKETLFASGDNEFLVENSSPSYSIVIEAQAPPPT